MYWLDVLIGLTLVNAVPHTIFGLFGIRFLSLFGLSPRANLSYGVLNFLIFLALFHIGYGLNALPGNGIAIGGLVVLFGYVLVGPKVKTWVDARGT